MAPIQTTTFEKWQRQAEIDGVGLIVGALVLRDGRFFAHRRAFDRKLFPGFWDLPGGHVEMGEGLLEALGREVLEETGWEIDEVIALATEFDWVIDGRTMREFDLVVTVKGQEEAILEAGKAIEGRWISRDETEIVADRGNHKMREIFDAGFSALDRLRSTVSR